jgi:hypothetical protein
MIEYAILLAVVIAAFLLLQAIVKRGVSGGINDAADRMGEQYSVSNTTMLDKREKQLDSTIAEETGTEQETLQSFVDAAGIDYDVVGTIERGAHSATMRTDEKYKTTSRELTDSATAEKYRWSEYQQDEDVYDDYELSDSDGGGSGDDGDGESGI